MGYYEGNDYYIIDSNELDFFTTVYAQAYFLLQKLYTNKRIKIKITKDFEHILKDVLSKKIEIPEIPQLHNLEKLRLDFNNKESVFVYYLISTESYSLSIKDRMYYTLELLFKDIDSNKNKYFTMRLIQDFFNELEENIEHYLYLEKYKEYFKEPIALANDKVDDVKDKKLEDYINNKEIFQKLMKGLVEIDFLNDQGTPIKSRRLASDLALLFIKLDNSKITSIKYTDLQMIEIIKNTFEKEIKKSRYNKLKQIEIDSNVGSKPDKAFYEKLSFIDTIHK